jgi:uncharacterized membrane protein YgdD (TMEM256/DUF423 family)
MRIAPKLILWLAALCGGLAVAFGAFAAHGVHDPRGAELLRTGAAYALVHAAAALATLTRAPAAALAFAVGGLVFSGSLYALAFGAPALTGAVTPIGGLFMILGWVLIAWTAAGEGR